ncbi:MAG: hypothetical protein WA971_10440 [Microbacterium sp.]
MDWDHLFDDLEGQLASEWEAERAALDAESERLRIARLDLRHRLRALCDEASTVTVGLSSDRRVRARLQTVGADWVAISPADDPRMLIVPLGEITELRVDHGALLASLDDPVRTSLLRERMTLGFVLRDLARRRVPVSLVLRDGALRHGTIDRAGADHLDIALHEPGEPRRAATVQGFCVVPFSALLRVRIEPADARLP